MYQGILRAICHFNYFCSMSLQLEPEISFQAFIQLAAEELLTETTQLEYETKFRNLTTWSSLNALLLISRINETTGVFISSFDLASLNTLGDIYKLILAKVNGTK